MVRESRVPDPPVGLGGVEELAHPEAGQPGPGFLFEAVEQIAIDAAAPQSLELAGEKAIHVLTRLDQPRRQFGGHEDPIAIASAQRFPDKTLAGPRSIEGGTVIRVGRVDVVHPMLYRIAQHLRGQGHVDAVGPPVDDRQTHTAETEDRYHLPGPAERPVEHGHRSSVSGSPEKESSFWTKASIRSSRSSRCLFSSRESVLAISKSIAFLYLSMTKRMISISFMLSGTSTMPASFPRPDGPAPWAN